MDLVKFVEEQAVAKNEVPAFRAGDTISVHYKIREGNKERIQSFKGDVIKRQGNGATASFTVRKISDGVGVERREEVGRVVRRLHGAQPHGAGARQAAHLGRRRSRR